MLASFASTVTFYLAFALMPTPSGFEVFFRIAWPVLLPLFCIPGFIYYLCVVALPLSVYKEKDARTRTRLVLFSSLLAFGVGFMLGSGHVLGGLLGLTSAFVGLGVFVALDRKDA